MSTYYDPNGGDKDAKDMLAMRQEKRRRNGEDDTDIRNGIGQFEMFTKVCVGRTSVNPVLHVYAFTSFLI